MALGHDWYPTRVDSLNRMGGFHARSIAARLPFTVPMRQRTVST